MVDSKYGTLVQTSGHPWDTYNKPDLFAPASQIVSARATDLSPQLPGLNYDCFGYGGNPPNYDPDYWIGSGTSFAAPVAAGAALIASRVYAAAIGGPPNPAAASPALLKAMLVAGSRSMRTGIDKTSTANPQPTIGERPNAVQGFGRISLADIVSHTPARQYVDQSPSRTFTAPGRVWSATYPVSDTNQPVKIVLTWTDAPAPAGSGNVPTLIQNDLDLFVNFGDSTNCQTYFGNNLKVFDTNPDQDLNRGEESIPYPCSSGNPDWKNNVEMALFYPRLAGMTQFTVVVRARQITASTIPDTNCPGNPNSDCFEQDFALFVYNAGAPINLAAPSNVVATAATSNSVNVTWSPVQGADHYEISRRDSGGYGVVNNTTTSTSFQDTTASPNTAYLYRVRALDPANNPGSYSSPDLATTVVFTDDPLVPQSTVIQAAHIDELRTAVNAVRTTAGLSGATFTDPLPSGINVKAVHVQELRSNLDPARSNLGLGALTYTDSTIVLGSTVVKAIHVAELRDGVK